MHKIYVLLENLFIANDEQSLLQKKNFRRQNFECVYTQ